MRSIPQHLLTAVPSLDLLLRSNQVKAAQTQGVLLRWQPEWPGSSSILFILAVPVSPATVDLLEGQGVPPHHWPCLDVPKASSALLGLRKAADHSHSGLGFMAHWWHSQSGCGMPSTKSTQTHHFHLSVLKTIQLVNLVWRSFRLAQVPAVVPSASIKPHPQHMHHIVHFVKFNSSVSTVP